VLDPSREYSVFLLFLGNLYFESVYPGRCRSTELFLIVFHFFLGFVLASFMAGVL
jgi:hypothetical protein